MFRTYADYREAVERQVRRPGEVWTVTRHSGRYGAEARVVFEGAEDLARQKYKKLSDEMRQGVVVLMRGTEVIQTGRAYRNRTRW